VLATTAPEEGFPNKGAPERLLSLFWTLSLFKKHQIDPLKPSGGHSLGGMHRSFAKEVKGEIHPPFLTRLSSNIPALSALLLH